MPDMMIGNAPNQHVGQVPLDMHFDDDFNEIWKALRKEPNLGRLITDLEQAHEAKHDGLVAQKKSEIDVLKAKNLKINELLGILGERLSDRSKSKIDLLHHGQLLKELAEFYPDLREFKENELTRGQAETLERALGRHMQLATQEISHEITRLTRLVEDKYQNTKIFQQLLQMLIDHGKTLTRNQRV